MKELSSIKIGYTHCISLKQLFSAIKRGKNVANVRETESGCEIRHTHNGPDHYYDIYTRSGALACMDGERCEVIAVGYNTITLINSETPFILTKDEAESALFI